jgi:pSer/pThr/pTyr-binding forkhead associated (FHA) protein
MENMGATRIYQEKDLGKTVVFKPAEQRKPIYGWLVVTEGPDAWKDFKIADEEVQLFLGKGEDCQLQLQDGKIEKIHASIRIKDGNMTITDFDTAAGTFVNDEAITKIELQDGDTLKVGESVLRFRKC